MTLPQAYLDPSHWQALPTDVLFSVYPGEDPTARLSDDNLPLFEPETVYQPVALVPAFILCRTSDSEKRLEGKLESREVMSGAWGTLHEVVGHGSVVGVVLAVSTDHFCGAHGLPDGVTLLARAQELPPMAIVQGIYEGKVVKMFAIGVPGDGPQDVVVTAKARWFRTRINPKFLGFSKDEKV